MIRENDSENKITLPKALMVLLGVAFFTSCLAGTGAMGVVGASFVHGDMEFVPMGIKFNSVDGSGNKIVDIKQVACNQGKLAFVSTSNAASSRRTFSAITMTKTGLPCL